MTIFCCIDKVRFLVYIVYHFFDLRLEVMHIDVVSEKVVLYDIFSIDAISAQSKYSLLLNKHCVLQSKHGCCERGRFLCRWCCI